MKKILSVFLIIAVLLTLSAASLSVSAEEAVKSDVTFFSTLGIFPEGVAEDAPVTRIGLAEVFYNIVFTDKTASGELWGESNFTDVPAEKKHIVETAAALGAMRGYSESIFAPDDAVTYTQTIKAIVSFLGYDLQANAMGGYPSGYLAQASRLQILPAGNVSGDSQVTYGGVAEILKKAINKDIAVWNHATTDGEAIQDILEGTDYLKYYMGISLTKGKVTGNYLTNVKSGKNTTFFGINLNGVKMDIAKTAHGVQDLLGYEVYVYYKDVEGVKTVIYYELGTNNVLEINSRDIAGVTSDSVKYYEDGYDDVFTATFPSNAALIYNGTYESSFAIADINPFAAGNVDGSIKLIDADADNVFETIVVTAFKTIVVKDVLNNKIYGEYDISGDPKDKVIDISNYKERNINIRNIEGEMVDPSGIRKGVVLNVCADKNGVVKEIIGSKDSMTGVISEISYKGTKISGIKIGGAEFKTSVNLVLVDSANKLKPGVTGTVFFNCKADIALIDLEQNYTDGYNTGYLVDAGIEGGIEKKVIAMVYDSTGEMKTFDLADRVVLNDKAEDAATVLSKFGTVNDRVKRQLILYKTDLDGKVLTAVEIPKKLQKDDDAYNGIYEFPGNSHYYSGGFRTVDDKYLVNNSTICFAVPGEADRDKYNHYSMTTFPNGEGYSIGSKEKPIAEMQIFGKKEEALVVSHAVLPSSTGGSSSGNDKRPLFVVSKVVTATDEDGETKLKVSGMFIEGTSLYEGFFYVKPELLISGHERVFSTSIVATGTRPFINQSETMIEPGDIFKVPFFRNNKNQIDSMNCELFYQLYDIGSDTFYENAGVYDSGIGYSVDRSSSGTHHYFGYVLYSDGTSVKTVLGNEVAPETPKYKAYEFSAGYYRFIEVRKRASDGQITVKAANADAIRAEKTFPGQASRIITFLRGVGIGCIILNYK